MTALSVDKGGAPAAKSGVRVRNVVKRKQLSLDDLYDGVVGGDRTVLANAITLIESTNPDQQARAQELLLKLLPHGGGASRIGITGVPGVGKSTFIEAFGKMLTAQGLKVAVLAVDPTSSRSGGSILGDKTRMAELSADPNAFIRPSPSSCTLGGVTRTTRETMAVCEAAGFDVILIETVGVGQSETVVADMVDFFLVLMLPGAGDELQGIKKGVLELADLIAVNKAEGDNAKRAKMAKREYQNALHIMKPISPNWSPPVLTISGLTGMGLDELWEKINEHKKALTDSGEYQEKRQQQQLRWMWAMVEDRLISALKSDPAVSTLVPDIQDGVVEGKLTATLGADKILKAFHN